MTNKPLDFIVVRAARCGTTYLHKFLNSNPSISLPAREKLHFFDNDKSFFKGYGYYNSFLGENKDSIFGEISPRYMLYLDSLRRIYEYNKQIKITSILRDPVKRVVSQFKYFSNVNNTEEIKHILIASQKSYVEDYVK